MNEYMNPALKGNVSDRKYWLSKVSDKQRMKKFIYFLEEADRDEAAAYIIRTSPSVTVEVGEAK